jgi:hypothetical protein
MNPSKQLIGRLFLATGSIGGMLLGYMQLSNANPLAFNFISQSAIYWIYSFVYIGFLASWWLLFEYTRKLEENQ